MFAVFGVTKVDSPWGTILPRSLVGLRATIDGVFVGIIVKYFSKIF